MRLNIEDILNKLPYEYARTIRNNLEYEYNKGYQQGAKDYCKTIDVKSRSVWKIKDYDRMRKENQKMHERLKELREQRLIV